MIIDWLERTVSRVRCRVFRRHDLGCRGRQDHMLPGGRNIAPERWTR